MRKFNKRKKGMFLISLLVGILGSPNAFAVGLSQSDIDDMARVGYYSAASSLLVVGTLAEEDSVSLGLTFALNEEKRYATLRWKEYDIRKGMIIAVFGPQVFEDLTGWEFETEQALIKEGLLTIEEPEKTEASFDLFFQYSDGAFVDGTYTIRFCITSSGDEQEGLAFSYFTVDGQPVSSEALDDMLGLGA
ncbi:MAG TPA: hypothetical protein VFC80_00950 [Sphaerochaeta sp.]|nr:hypothetical protein [Sphaerochaeta sp.]